MVPVVTKFLFACLIIAYSGLNQIQAKPLSLPSSSDGQESLNLTPGAALTLTHDATKTGLVDNIIPKAETSTIIPASTLIPATGDDTDNSSWFARIANIFKNLTVGQCIWLAVGVVTCFFIALLCCICRCEDCGCCRWLFVTVFGAVAVGISFIATPIALFIAGVMGFTAAGVAAGSCASRAQSYEGNIDEGSLFARLQSYGARQGYGRI